MHKLHDHEHPGYALEVRPGLSPSYLWYSYPPPLCRLQQLIHRASLQSCVYSANQAHSMTLMSLYESELGYPKPQIPREPLSMYKRRSLHRTRPKRTYKDRMNAYCRVMHMLQLTPYHGI